MDFSRPEGNGWQVTSDIYQMEAVFSDHELIALSDSNSCGARSPKFLNFQIRLEAFFTKTSEASTFWLMLLPGHRYRPAEDTR